MQVKIGNTSNLNTYDHYPVVSTVFSGPLRILTGAVQTVANIVLFPLAVLFWICGCEAWGGIKQNIGAIFDGCTDILRGAVALVPLIGNLALYLIDSCGSNEAEEMEAAQRQLEATIAEARRRSEEAFAAADARFAAARQRMDATFADPFFAHQVGRQRAGQGFAGS